MLKCCFVKAIPFPCLFLLFLTVTFPQYFIALLESWYHLHPSDSLSVPHHLLSLWFFYSWYDSLSFSMSVSLSLSRSHFLSFSVSSVFYSCCNSHLTFPSLWLLYNETTTPSASISYLPHHLLLFFSFFKNYLYNAVTRVEREEWHRMEDKRRLFALKKTGFFLSFLFFF